MMTTKTAKQITINGTEQGATAQRALLPRVLDETLRSAKTRLANKLDEGMSCPCCGQHAQRYKRAFAKSIARALIQIHEAAKATAVHEKTDATSTPVQVSRIAGLRGGDYARAAWWGLLATFRDAMGDKDAASQGWWLITQAGVDFVEGRTRVAAHVFIYNGTVLDERSINTVSIFDVLDNTEIRKLRGVQ